MPTRCPVCKAENNQAAQCRRCKADLSLLIAVEKHRASMIAEASACLVRGDAEGALAWATEADWFRHDDDSRQLVAVAQLLNGDFAAAWQSYQSIAEMEPNGPYGPSES